MGILFIIILSFICNISNFFINIKINYYKGKFGLKKTPIYKLSYIGMIKWEERYGVEKWFIKYEILDSNPLVMLFGFLFCPIFCWFKFPYYEKHDDVYGSFTLEEGEKLVLDTYFEDEYSKSLEKHTSLLNRDKVLSDRLNKINKDFRENYGKDN